jgi:prevent-host-death family protein
MFELADGPALNALDNMHPGIDSPPDVLHSCATVKKATVRELRNHYSRLLDDISAGEEILITRRGKAVAKLVPLNEATGDAVDWSTAPEVLRDRRRETRLTAKESADILKASRGQW